MKQAAQYANVFFHLVIHIWLIFLRQLFNKIFQLARNLPTCRFLKLIIILLAQQIIHAHTIKISKIPQSSQLRHSFAMLYLGNRRRSIGAIISFIVLLPEFRLAQAAFEP